MPVRSTIGIFTAIVALALAGNSFPQSIEEQRAAARARAEEALRLLIEQLAQAQAEAEAQQAARGAMMQTAESPPSPGEGGGGGGAFTPVPHDYGCGLWLSLSNATATNVLLTLHNTLPGTNYQVLSKTSLASASWTVEITNVTGASGQDYTQTNVLTLGRSNLFFIASEVKDYVMATNYAGLSFADTQIDPPDTMGAVGPNHFVEILNGKITVFDKTNGQRIAEEWTTNVFRVTVGGTNYPEGLLVDPRILYDSQSNRWVACGLDLGRTTNHVILAVSSNASPLPLLSNWTKHVVTLAPGNIKCDYDTLGMDANGLYLSVWHFEYYDTLGYTVAAIKKPDLYLGNLQVTLLTNNLVSPPGFAHVFAIQPAVNFDDAPVGGYAWFVAMTRYHELNYRRLQWDGATASWADTNGWRALPDSTPTYRDYFEMYDVFDPHVIKPPQAGGTNGLDLQEPGGRLMNAVIRNGFLYTCHQVGLSGTNGSYCCDTDFGGDVDRTGLQWFKLEISTNAEPLTVYDHGRIYSAATTNAHWYYYPSMAVNCAGDMAFGFSGSSATNYISAYYAWRPACGSVFVTPRLIQPGLDYYNNTSWGDYSYTSLDPTDGMTFWTVQEFAEEPIQSIAQWGTRIARVMPRP